MAEEFSVGRIEKLRYRPSRDAEEFLESLRKEVVPGEKFRVARLAFARSLQEAGDPPALEKGVEQGGAIEGMHLFGDFAAEWACAFTVATERQMGSLDDFRSVVEAHWHRGSMLLKQDFASVDEKPAEFALLLAARVGKTGSAAAWRRYLRSAADLIAVSAIDRSRLWPHDCEDTDHHSVARRSRCAIAKGAPCELCTVLPAFSWSTTRRSSTAGLEAIVHGIM